MLLTVNCFGQKVTEEQKERANELFENEQYVEATPLYLQILSLEPTEAEWNFKYGACLLYNAGEKQEALRYLKYGVNTEGTDHRVFYFYGRALHLDYQFSAAKKYYQQYQSKRSKPDKRYPVERELRMCDNGQKLLTTFTDIIVTDKVQISENRFYDIYMTSQTVKGTITVNRDFQSKLDKKKGHIPIVHYGPNAKMIFYSSWGDDESTGKDIYQRIKLPDGSWGKPQLVPGAVNTNEDEDYPFLHASGDFLYFSSKGHNSMGGYDIFVSRRDPNTNAFGPPENVDFAISSPGDDLFYVVDETFSNAYFASARSSEQNMLHVYKVKVVRVPIQEVIVMGNFTSDIHPEDQKIKLSILKNANGDELTKMPVSAEKGGRYSYVFPQGGKYDYVVEVEGSGTEFKFTIDLPYLDEFRPLKQEIIHTTENGNEIIRIINKFDESVEGAEAIIAEIIRKKSELDVNVDKFDLEAIENQQNLDGLLVELGFENMSLREVSSQLSELEIAARTNEETIDRVSANVSSEMLAKMDRVKELDKMEEELRSSAEKANDPVTSHKLLTEASQKQQEKEQLLRQVEGLEALIEDVNNLGDNQTNPEALQTIKDQFESLRKEDEQGALEYLASEKDVINQAKETSPNAIKNAYTEEIISKRKAIKEASDRRNEYIASVKQLESKLNTLEREKEGAKRKDLERIENEIISTKDAIAKREKEIERLSQEVAKLEQELDATEERLASYQNAISTEEKSDVDPTEIAEAKEEVKAITSEEAYNYEEALANLESEHPEINGGQPIVDYTAQLEEKYDEQKAEIQNDTSLTPLEQTSRMLENNEEIQQELQEQLTQVQEQLKVEESEHLREQEAALQAKKSELEAENAILEAEEKRLKQETPDAALSKEDVLTEVAPNVLADIASIQNDSNTSELEKFQEELKVREDLVFALEREDGNLSEVLQSNSGDESVKAKQELIRQLISENEQAIEGLKSNIDALSPTVTTEVTALEVIAEVNNSYQETKAEILSNDGTPLQQEEALLELNESLLEDLQKESSRTEDALKDNPDDSNLLSKKQAIQEAIALTESDIAENNQNIAALTKTTEPSVSSAEVLAEIAPDLEADQAAIQNGSGTPLEKEEALKELEEEIIADLEKDLAKWQKRVDRDPENTEAADRVKALSEAISERQEVVAGIDNRIAELQNNTSVASVSVEEILSELAPDQQTEFGEIDGSDATESEKYKRKASVVAGILETLKKEQEDAEKQLERNLENKSLIARKEAIDQAISQQENQLKDLQQSAVTELTEQEKEAMIAEVLPSYSNNSASQSVKDQVAGEEELQAALEDEITNKEKQQKRKYSVSVSIEQAIQEQLLEESKQRLESLQSSNVASSGASEYIDGIRSENGSEVTSALTNDETDLAALNNQEDVLAAYEADLDDRIKEQEEALESNPTQENEDMLSWLVDEKDRVAKKRRSISISIGELEQVAATNTTQNSDVERLKEEEQRIRDSQTAEDLSNSERKQLNRELREVTEQRFALENEQEETQLTESKNASESMQESLVSKVESDNGIAQSTLEYAQQEKQAIEALEKEAQEAGSEAERNYLLKEASKRQDALNNDLQDAIIASELAEIEEEYNIATTSRTDLQKQKRSYTIQLGEISREIEQVNQEMSQAKRKELPELEAKRVALIGRQEQIQARLDRVNDQLSKVEEVPSAIDNRAMDEEISFKEERELAATDAYETYQKAAVEALMVANEIRTLEEELGERRNELQRAVRNREPDEMVRRKAEEVQSLEAELDRKEIELTQKKFDADQALPENEADAMKMQNLVARGIQPLKVTAVAATLIQMPTTGFAIDTTAERPNNGAIEIPVGVENPEGLVYRVQVGAFARPLRPDVFKEFNPVSGEKIEGTNITRYMAGYFNSSESVVDAQQQIRGLGYSDAFVVAYCNGERISLGEARRREAAGICVPKRSEEIMIEVAENTAKNLNIPISTEPEELPEWSYAQAPGAADAEPIEKMEGLFFTVQIGVFNRAVTDSELKNLPKISTFRLPNGQIRYNTGIFDSAEDALPRQNLARRSGIDGAFIVAYYQGKRISIGNARRLLLEYGPSILQSQKELAPELEEIPVVRMDSVRRDVIEIAPMEEWEKRVQIVTEATFEEFPRDVLNRYNAEGSFYFDEKDKRVKSTIYENEDYLPNLFNFKDDVDTVYLEEGLLEDQKTETIYFVFSDSLVPGAFMDWMLRCNYRRSINRSAKGTEVRIFGVEEEDMDGMIERIRLFGVEPEKILEE